MPETKFEFSAHTYEGIPPTPAVWQTHNGSVPVTVIAYSLGATIALCIIGLSSRNIEPGNYAVSWLPVDQVILDYEG